MALSKEGFVYLDINEKAVIGKRGLRAHEWETLVAVYYSVNDKESDIYVKTEISQDPTCGPESDRAKAIVKGICQSVKGCSDIKEIKKKTKELAWKYDEINPTNSNRNNFCKSSDFKIHKVSSDSTYGYLKTNPVKIGDSDQDLYFDHLCGPKDEVISATYVESEIVHGLGVIDEFLIKIYGEAYCLHYR